MTCSSTAAEGVPLGGSIDSLATTLRRTRESDPTAPRPGTLRPACGTLSYRLSQLAIPTCLYVRSVVVKLYSRLIIGHLFAQFKFPAPHYR